MYSTDKISHAVEEVTGQSPQHIYTHPAIAKNLRNGVMSVVIGVPIHDGKRWRTDNLRKLNSDEVRRVLKVLRK